MAESTERPSHCNRARTGVGAHPGRPRGRHALPAAPRLPAADPAGGPGRRHRPDRRSQRLRQGRAREPAAPVVTEALSARARAATSGSRSPSTPAAPTATPGWTTRPTSWPTATFAAEPRRGAVGRAAEAHAAIEQAPHPATAAATGPREPSGLWPARRRRDTEPSRLNPKYTFDTFVIGSSNRFAHAAAVAVAEAPGEGVQPAVHLRRVRAGQDPPAARHRPLRAQPLHRRAGALRRARRSSPTSSSTRIRDDKAAGVPAPLPRRRRAARSTTSSSCRARSRRRRSSSTRSTRCTTRTSRSSSPPTCRRKRLSGVRGPHAHPVRVGPDHRRPAARPRDPHRDPAQEGGPGAAVRRRRRSWSTSPARSPTNIRELEGALIRVTAFASLNRQPVDLALAEIVLKDLIPDSAGPEITAALIMAQTAAYFGLSMEDLCGSSPLAGPGHRPPDRHVPVPRAHRPVAAQDRPAVRRPRPHHGHARRPQDPPADGRAPRRSTTRSPS